MEPSNNYQTTVDTDTFHPREADPADVARVSPRPFPSPLVPLEISSNPPETRPISQVAQGGEGLPAPSGDDASVPKLDINSGESIAMDAMGPVVVNDDGSLSRIANWPMLTDREKEVTQRRIAKRNKERLDRLREAAKENERA